MPVRMYEQFKHCDSGSNGKPAGSFDPLKYALCQVDVLGVFLNLVYEESRIHTNLAMAGKE